MADAFRRKRTVRPRLTGDPGLYEPSVDLLYKMVRIDDASGCHLWTGAPNQHGYGRIGINYRDYLAHRLSYELQVGPIPKGLAVCHKCDTPACINPDHLFIGTQSDNHADMVAKNRHRRGSRQWNAKLTEDDVRTIRALTSSSSEVAKAYGITPKAVRLIRSRKNWKHVA